jgi:hypothetical protein
LTQIRDDEKTPAELLATGDAVKLKQGLGNWVDGDRFFNREKEMAVFRTYLLDGVSLLLVAPRRIGKTSFMREAGRQLETEIVALHVDLQKANSAEEAIVELGLACRLLEPMWKRALGAFGQLFGRIESLKLSELSVTLRGLLNSTNWRQKGDELIGVLSEYSKEVRKPVVVFFDEVPILVNRLLHDEAAGSKAERRARADELMSWMRDNLIRHKSRVVFVVTGSIGLEPVLRSAGLSGTLNAFHSFDLRPWKDETAAACLLALALEKEFPLPTAVAAHMVKLLGSAIPHHVQLYFDHVFSSYVLDEAAGEVTVAYVDEVYSTRMIGLRGHADLMHMEERLRLVLTESRFCLALTLLTEAAAVGLLTVSASKSIVSSHRATNDDLLETLAILEHDGYLCKQADRFVFVSNLVRDWWRNRFGFGYCPAQ